MPLISPEIKQSAMDASSVASEWKPGFLESAEANFRESFEATSISESAGRLLEKYIPPDKALDFLGIHDKPTVRNALMTTEDANKRYWFEGMPKFESPLKERDAYNIHREWVQRLTDQKTISEESGWARATGIPISFAAFLADPANIALAEVQWLRAPTVARVMMGRLGPLAGKMAVGSVDNAISEAISQSLIYARSQQDHMDYTFADALSNVGMVGVFGAALHAVPSVYRRARGRPDNLMDDLVKAHPEIMEKFTPAERAILESKLSPALRDAREKLIGSLGQLANGKSVNFPETMAKVDDRLDKSASDRTVAHPGTLNEVDYAARYARQKPPPAGEPMPSSRPLKDGEISIKTPYELEMRKQRVEDVLDALRKNEPVPPETLRDLGKEILERLGEKQGNEMATLSIKKYNQKIAQDKVRVEGRIEAAMRHVEELHQSGELAGGQPLHTHPNEGRLSSTPDPINVKAATPEVAEAPIKKVVANAKGAEPKGPVESQLDTMKSLLDEDKKMFQGVLDEATIKELDKTLSKSLSELKVENDALEAGAACVLKNMI